MPGSGVTIPKMKLKNLRTANPSMYAADLALLVFGRETLANSSVTGRQSGAHKDIEAKPPLDNEKLEATIGEFLRQDNYSMFWMS